MAKRNTMNERTLPTAHRFVHEAMNTTFQLWIRTSDAEAASGMARECIEQLDLLEGRLSRFIDGSEVSQINHLKAGETLYLSEVCHQCLLAAVDAYARTGGLFDITLGTRIAQRKANEPEEELPLVGRLVIHPDVAAVTCEVEGREIDLGGIGKGFALDQLKQTLIEWGADGGLLTAGASSMVAFGPEAWPIDLTGSDEVIHLSLLNLSLSASGTGVQGEHILHPGGKEAMPEAPLTRLWVTATTATLAEIWSTALMLVEPDSISEFIAGETTLTGVYADRGGPLLPLFP
jgi:FAD:protein FMN transferase